MNNNEQQKQAEPTSIVSRFFSFMLALVTLKTDTSIAATTRRAQPIELPVPAATPAPQTQTTAATQVAPSVTHTSSMLFQLTKTPASPTSPQTTTKMDFFDRFKDKCRKIAQELYDAPTDPDGEESLNMKDFKIITTHNSRGFAPSFGHTRK